MVGFGWPFFYFLLQAANGPSHRAHVQRIWTCQRLKRYPCRTWLRLATFRLTCCERALVPLYLCSAFEICVDIRSLVCYSGDLNRIHSSSSYYIFYTTNQRLPSCLDRVPRPLFFVFVGAATFLSRLSRKPGGHLVIATCSPRVFDVPADFDELFQPSPIV